MSIYDDALKLLCGIGHGERLIHDSASFQADMRRVADARLPYEFGRTANSRFYVELLTEAKPLPKSAAKFPFRSLRKGEWFTAGAYDGDAIDDAIRDYTETIVGAKPEYRVRPYSGGLKITRIA